MGRKKEGKNLDLPFTWYPCGAVGEKVKVRDSQQIFGRLFPVLMALDTR